MSYHTFTEQLICSSLLSETSTYNATCSVDCRSAPAQELSCFYGVSLRIHTSKNPTIGVTSFITNVSVYTSIGAVRSLSYREVACTPAHSALSVSSRAFSAPVQTRTYTHCVHTQRKGTAAPAVHKRKIMCLQVCAPYKMCTGVFSLSRLRAYRTFYTPAFQTADRHAFVDLHSTLQTAGMEHALLEHRVT